MTHSTALTLARDALAEKLREAFHAKTQIGHPMWRNLSDDRKAPWLAAADAASELAASADAGSQPGTLTDDCVEELVNACSHSDGNARHVDGRELARLVELECRAQAAKADALEKCVTEIHQPAMPEDFGVPTLYADRARNYARWLLHEEGAQGDEVDAYLRCNVADLVHLLSYADIRTPSEGDARQAKSILATLRAYLKQDAARAQQGSQE